ncbi:helix-turn-helix domain-containing protein [Ligilactobacillus murinus]|uniref:Rha family transcriptional regulator n=1 Tax=Ligilactobacillus murinus TaxID=1622 RepID=UPI001C8B3077|nr:Rha family transcriptional regulator [Ligilactobacillus murinus]MBX9012768.1 helix-turn-helix domain-containing protein [Ligilactobacillus murinus]
MKTKKLNSTIAMLKEYKENNRITYEELSHQTGYNTGTLNSWINGTVKPLPESLKAVEQFLNRVYASKFVDIAEANKAYIDSRLVAQWAGKTHKNLVRDIKGYINDLEKSQAKLSLELKSEPYNKNRSINVFKPQYYFIESHYTHPINKRKLPCYLVTQRGCEMIANKMTGVKGIAFTALYIDEYHRLKSEDTQTIEAPQEAPKIEQVSLFDHEPQTPEERDLLYLKQRLLEDTKDARTIVSFAVGISKTWKVLKAIKDAKHITDYN